MHAETREAAIELLKVRAGELLRRDPEHTHRMLALLQDAEFTPMPGVTVERLAEEA